LQGKVIGTWEYNITYESGVERVKLPPKSSEDSQRVKRFMRHLKIANVKSRLGLSPWNMLAAALFKVEPEHDLIYSMQSSGWRIKFLPQNPYLGLTN
jgi:hypothetical protein